MGAAAKNIMDKDNCIDLFREIKVGKADPSEVNNKMSDQKFIKAKIKRVAREKMYMKYNMAIKLRSLKGKTLLTALLRRI